MQTSVFSHFADSCTIVARARAVRMSPGATPEAQGARRSGRAEGTRRGLSARRNPRRGKRVKVVHGGSLYRIVVVWKVLCQGVIFDSLVEWDSILLHAVEEWSGSNAAIDGFVIFDLGGCKIAVTAISIRSREKVGSVEGIGGVYSGRAPDLALRSLDSGWLAAHRTKDREISR